MRVRSQLAHRGVEIIQNFLGFLLPLGVGLSRNGIVDGRAGRGQDIDAEAQRAAYPLGDGNRHIGRVAQCIQPGVDEDGRQQFSLLACVLHDTAHLDLYKSRGEISRTPLLQAPLGLIEPLLNSVARLPMETLVLAVMLNALLGLADRLHRGAVLSVQIGERLVCLRELHETHQAVVIGAVNHCYVTSCDHIPVWAPTAEGLLSSCILAAVAPTGAAAAWGSVPEALSACAPTDPTASF